MDRLREMEVFQAVAAGGSFAGAARRLAISPPSVTRAVSSLEARLGVRLLYRTTRRLSLTEAGVRFLESTARLLTGIEDAEKQAAGERALPQGHLRVTASVTFGRRILTPILADFLDSHPLVTTSVLLFDRVVDLVEEGIDAGIRIGELPSSTLIARRVGSVRRLLVASPDYLARHGTPRAPQDLKHHTIIAFLGLMPNREWRYRQGRAEKSVALAPRMEINDAAAAIAGAEAGQGITAVLSYMVADRIKAGHLVAVLEPLSPPAIPVQLVYPESHLLAPKVRAFIDFAAPRLTAALKDLA